MSFQRRLALIVVLILIAGAGATPALAGEYPVFACEPSLGDVNNSWVGAQSEPAMAVYANCPPGGAFNPWNDGLVTRAAMVSGSVPANAHSRLTFRAPPGASLSRMAYTHRFCGGSSFTAGLMNDAFAWLHKSDPGSCGTLVPSPYAISLGGTPAVHLITWCVSSRCNLSTSSPMGYAAMRNATVWVTDYTAPSIALTGGAALTPGWKSGVVDLAFSTSDNVGIQEGDIRRGADLVWQRTNTCNHTLAVPCPPIASHVEIDTRGAADGEQRLTVRALDTAKNLASRTVVISADNTAPGPPLDLSVAGGTGWRSRNSFEITWRNPSQAGMAPIAGSEIAICPASNTADQWTGCQQRSEATTAAHVLVPTAGQWIARVWLRDEAGNASRATAQAIELRLDDTPPSVAFKAVDPSDPTRIDVRATDATSGLVETAVEVQRRGTGTWVPLPAQRTSDGFSARLDDEQLADGAYDLRARATDGAGNERSTDRETSGAKAHRSVPMRIATRLVAGHVTYVGARRSRDGRRRRVIVVRPKVPYGRTLPIDGRLTMPGGNAIPGGQVEVWEQLALPDAGFRRIAVIGTDTRGRFRFKALRGPSRILRFRYPGTAVVRARTTEVELRVKSATSLTTSRSRVVNGEDVVLAGRLSSRPLPASGKLVQLQAYSRGGWITFATPRADAKTGRWSHRYRFTSTRGTVRYRFRARVPTEATYPYTTGTSRSVRVRVRGL